MKFIKSISWQEIFSLWKKQEAGIWDAAIASKNVETWEEWRSIYFSGLNLETKNWQLFEVESEDVKYFQCGLFPRWKEFAESVQSRKIADIARISFFESYEKIKKIQEDFPEHSLLIGLKNGENVILLEGHHRAVAMARDTKNHQVFLALAEVETPFVYVDQGMEE